jgi:hypothetical protein
MTGLEMISFILGVSLMFAGIAETTKQALAPDSSHLSLRRWALVYLLAILPFVVVAAPLIWLGTPAVTR